MWMHNSKKQSFILIALLLKVKQLILQSKPITKLFAFLTRYYCQPFLLLKYRSFLVNGQCCLASTISTKQTSKTLYKDIINIYWCIIKNVQLNEIV